MCSKLYYVVASLIDRETFQTVERYNGIQTKDEFEEAKKDLEIDHKMKSNCHYIIDGSVKIDLVNDNYRIIGRAAVIPDEFTEKYGACILEAV